MMSRPCAQETWKTSAGWRSAARCRNVSKPQASFQGASARTCSCTAELSVSVALPAQLEGGGAAGLADRRRSGRSSSTSAMIPASASGERTGAR